jgi:hypothetical protein
MTRISIVILVFVLSACQKSTEPSESTPAKVQGIVEYYVDTLVYAGGGGEPSAYILKNYQWIRGNPGYTYKRVYFQDSRAVEYAGKMILVEGRVDTLWGHAFVGRYPFPNVVASKVTTLE